MLRSCGKNMERDREGEEDSENCGDWGRENDMEESLTLMDVVNGMGEGCEELRNGRCTGRGREVVDGGVDGEGVSELVAERRTRDGQATAGGERELSLAV